MKLATQLSASQKMAVIGIAVLSVTFVQCDEGRSSYSESHHDIYTEEEAADGIAEQKSIAPYHPGYQDPYQQVTPQPYDFEHDVQNEQYAHVEENGFEAAITQPLSTFSIDVDNASYTNVRRIIKSNQLPSADAIRIEEMINYFDYNYTPAERNEPFSINSEVAQCPWNQDNRLVRIGIQGLDVDKEELPPNNLVFLLDVSGSMNQSNKLPLLKRAFNMMVDELNEDDYVSIVTYAGNTSVVLPPTSCSYKDHIKSKMYDLHAGGSTNGSGGIQLAYQQAEQNLLPRGNNRIILATDGDFNVGISDQQQLIQLMEAKRNLGIDITVLGFGMGNLKDASMEAMANNGNGNYFYIDSDREAQHTLVDNLSGTLLTIAKDVKVQVEFNPAKVKAYRLIGYENRKMANSDFRNDAKDAGELGAGHTVTAVYEVTPATYFNANEELKYQTTVISREAYESAEILTVKLRYKHPKGTESMEMTDVVYDNWKEFSAASKDFRLASCVGAFGMLLKNSGYKGDLSYAQLIVMTQNAIDGSREQKELVELIQRASALNTLVALH